ncbi:MAG: type III-A CRISPR-associated RAMP protein Csm3 [Phormidesmis sp. CAN_BIN44]|nr:type III-A CRISPR-associated RAMP protein Csm3 [Phormidesmis sp. CAN_BIN44]
MPTGGAEYTKVSGRNAPARLIVRDCHLDPVSIKKLKLIDTGLNMTEWKFENGIDRTTSAANPRQVERVPAGSVFRFELEYTIDNETQVIEDLKNSAIALATLEDDALGGHGSRGYGKIKF